MALETSDIINLIRLELDDPELPGSGDSSDSLWSNEELYHYLDEAQREFARETLCLPDFTYFNSVAVTADDPWVAIDDRIVELRKVYLNSTGLPIEVITLQEFEHGSADSSDYGSRVLNGDWQTSKGPPRYIITDMEADKGRLYPIPTANDALTLSVYREPLEEVESGVDLEISPRFRRSLVQKACAMAYAKDDAETYNEVAMNKRLILWRDALDSALSFFRKKRRRAPVVMYGGI